jgi:hypothetical protein
MFKKAIWKASLLPSALATQLKVPLLALRCLIAPRSEVPKHHKPRLTRYIARAMHIPMHSAGEPNHD